MRLVQASTPSLLPQAAVGRKLLSTSRFIENNPFRGETVLLIYRNIMKPHLNEHATRCDSSDVLRRGLLCRPLIGCDQCLRCSQSAITGEKKYIFRFCCSTYSVCTNLVQYLYQSSGKQVLSLIAIWAIAAQQTSPMAGPCLQILGLRNLQAKARLSDILESSSSRHEFGG